MSAAAQASAAQASAAPLPRTDELRGRARRVAVLSRSWDASTGPGSPATPSAEAIELSGAIRSLSGALSRRSAVDVLVPAGVGTRHADGAFDPIGIGLAAPGATWPAPAMARFEPAGSYSAAVVEDGDAEAVSLARALLPGVPVLAVGRAHAPHPRAGVTGLLDVSAAGALGEAGDRRPRGAPWHGVGLYARVHPYAAERPHLELGPVASYLLVLSGRAGAATPDARMRWLLARFARRHVVVVEDAHAHVWRSRSELFAFEVHSRMDLWRLIAHASATVDLAPGPLYGRECVESLRYGVPVVAPEGSSVDPLARAGALLAFSGTTGLIRQVASLDDPAVRSRLAAAGKDLAQRWYGDPAALVERLEGALGALGAL